MSQQGYILEIIGNKNKLNMIYNSNYTKIVLNDLSSSELEPAPNEEYDYIIAGMGPAACVAAIKLAELHPNKSIVLISNGPEPPNKLQFYNPPNNVSLGGELPFDPLVSVAAMNFTQLSNNQTLEEDINYWAASGNGWIFGSLVVSDSRQYPGLESELQEVLRIINSTTLVPLAENPALNDPSMQTYVDLRQKFHNIIEQVEFTRDNVPAYFEALRLNFTTHPENFSTGPRLDYAALTNNFSNISKVYNRAVVGVTTQDNKCNSVRIVDSSGNITKKYLTQEGSFIIAAGYQGTTCLMQQMINANVPITIPSSLPNPISMGLPLGDETLAFAFLCPIRNIDIEKVKFQYPGDLSLTSKISSSPASYDDIKNGLAEVILFDTFPTVMLNVLIGQALKPELVNEVSQLMNLQPGKDNLLINCIIFQGTQDYGGSDYSQSYLKNENYIHTSAVDAYPTVAKRTATTSNIYSSITDGNVATTDQQMHMTAYNWKDSTSNTIKDRSYNRIYELVQGIFSIIRKLSNEYSDASGVYGENEPIGAALIDISDPFSGTATYFTSDSSFAVVKEQLINNGAGHSYHCSSGLTDFVDPTTLKVNGLDNVHIGDQSVLPFVFTNSTMVSSQCMAVRAAENA